MELTDLGGRIMFIDMSVWIDFFFTKYLFLAFFICCAFWLFGNIFRKQCYMKSNKFVVKKNMALKSDIPKDILIKYLESYDIYNKYYTTP